MASHDEGQIRAQAALKRFELLERQQLEAVYDWYGLSCPCNLPPGKCRIHPRARLKQRPPSSPWRVWFLRAGRNGGKTFPSAKFVNWKVETRQWKEIVFVNATIGDTRDIMVLGPSGVVATSPPWCKAVFLPARSQVEWRTNNGDGDFIARAYLRTSEVPDGLRGPNADGVWGDEPGKWVKPQETWDQIEFVMRNRIEPPPQCILSGTPVSSPVMQEIQEKADQELANPGSTGFFITSWHTRENEEHMDPAWLASMLAKWEGTLMGQQELGGEMIVRRAGALWAPEDFDREGFRFRDIPEDIEYLGVAIDPGAGSEDEKHASEAGIVVGARLAAKPGQWVSHAVILDDRTTSGKPGDWGAAVVRAYHDWGANEIIAEKNQGGEMVRHVIQSVPAQVGYPSGKNIPIKLVYASVGKTARAEPVQALYQAKRVRHRKGYVSSLEQQMVQFVPGKHGQKLDRVDALVWFLTEALLEHDSGGEAGPIVFGGSRARLVYQGMARTWEETE